MNETINKHRLKLKVSRIIQILENYLGVPKQPKQKADPLNMLIATLLSQNTNDRNSHRAYLCLKQKYPTWELVAKESTRKIALAIRSGGMANQKSKRIKKILFEIYRKFGDYDLRFLKRMSDEEIFKLLLEFDGVGIKTAACVLLFSLGRDVFPVDTHIHRICNRLKIVHNCKTPDKTFEQMRLLVPDGKAYSFHTNLIRFGRKICRSNHPLCGLCPLIKECGFVSKKIYQGSKVSKVFERDVDFMVLDHV